jgi:hypothetical protein
MLLNLVFTTPKVATPLPEANFKKQVTEQVQPIKVETLPQPQQELVPVAVEEPVIKPPSGSLADWMQQARISPTDYDAVNFIVSHESGGNPLAKNASSGAYGLCQALPGSKMASISSDWQTNPVTQLKWCSQYAQSRYGSWNGAMSFWIKSHWW